MTKDELEATLKVLVAHAKSARDQGITALTVGGVSVQFAPRDQPEPVVASKSDNTELEKVIAADEKQKQQGRRGPLHDPDLFPRGRVPGRQRIGDDDD